jgi:hypothetical protein
MHPAPSGDNPATSPVASTYADAFTALESALAAVRAAREGASERALAIADCLCDIPRHVPLAHVDPLGLGDQSAERAAAYNHAVRIAAAAREVRELRRTATFLARREDAEEAGHRILGESGIAGPRETEVHANGRGEGADVWLSLYRVDLCDGGPEEGGWHWTRRELIASVKRSGFLRAEDDALTSAADADARAALASVAEAHGLTLDGHHVMRPDGSTRPARGYRSAAPEVDAQIIAERVVGSNVDTSAPSYE